MMLNLAVCILTLITLNSVYLYLLASQLVPDLEKIKELFIVPLKLSSVTDNTCFSVKTISHHFIFLTLRNANCKAYTLYDGWGKSRQNYNAGYKAASLTVF